MIFTINADTPEDVRQEVIASIERIARAYDGKFAIDMTAKQRTRADGAREVLATMREIWGNVVIEPKGRE